jgi:FKBP-type peptidyl-prolyl cis-trans isomerase
MRIRTCFVLATLLAACSQSTPVASEAASADEAAAEPAADEAQAAEAEAPAEEGAVQAGEPVVAEVAEVAAAPGDLAAPADVAAVPDDATVTASGLASRVLQAGTGTEMPSAADTVTVHYTGWTTDGQMFDSSVQRGEPTSFPLNRVIAGWTEGLQLMVVGEKRRFWIPAGLAYGDNPRGGRPAGMLVFDVELLDIQRAPEPPSVPEDVGAIPDNAEVLPSGLASRVLQPGTGSVHPTAASSVSVHYSGWTTDGQMFDSSVMRGQPARFPLRGVIAGWTEGVPLMVVGEKRRFWIPADLAYGEEAAGGRPSGMLVFDIELLEIMN